MWVMQRLRVVMAVGLLGLVPGLAGAGIVRAAGSSYTVSPGGTATCSAGQQVGASFGTIQAALDCAQQDNPPASNPDTIRIAAGTYGENIAVAANVNLVGAGGGAVIDGRRNTHTVGVLGGYTVTITDLTIVNGFARIGGGIFNLGTLTLTNSAVSDNSGQEAGGILNRGTLILNNSIVSNNMAQAVGGGVLNEGTLTVSNSIVKGNIAGSGGGIYNDGLVTSATATLINSAVKGNTALGGNGSGIYNIAGSVTLIDSTVSKNNQLLNQCYGC